jgi:hypothetical protein
VSESAGPEPAAVAPETARIPAQAALAAPALAIIGTAGAAPAIARLSHSNATAQRVALMRALQTGAGNAQAIRLLRQAADDAAPTSAADPASTADGGTPGGATLVVEEDFVPQEFSTLPDEELHVHDEGGFVDGGQTGTAAYGEGGDESHPHAFTDGGQTGTVKWAGGGGAGAHGNEPAGSIQAQTAPVYESKANASSKDPTPGSGRAPAR